MSSLCICATFAEDGTIMSPNYGQSTLIPSCIARLQLRFGGSFPDALMPSWRSVFAEEQPAFKFTLNHARTKHTSRQRPVGMSPRSIVGRSAMGGRRILVADDPKQRVRSCTFGFWRIRMLRRIFPGFVVRW